MTSINKQNRKNVFEALKFDNKTLSHAVAKLVIYAYRLCLGVASCTWCDSEDGISPFCGTWGECHLGPQTEADEPQGWFVGILCNCIVFCYSR